MVHTVHGAVHASGGARVILEDKVNIKTKYNCFVVSLSVTLLILVWAANGRLQARVAATDNSAGLESTVLHYLPIIFRGTPVQITNVWIENDGAWSLISTGDSVNAVREPANYDNVDLVSNYYANVSFNTPPLIGQPFYSMARGYYYFDLSHLPEQTVAHLSLTVRAQVKRQGVPMSVYIHEGTWGTGFRKENWHEYGALLTTYEFLTAPGADEIAISLPSFIGQLRPDFIKLVIRVEEMTTYPSIEVSPSFSAIVRPNEHLEIPPEYRARLVVGLEE
jgi:hypothetical protein